MKPLKFINLTLFVYIFTFSTNLVVESSLNKIAPSICKIINEITSSTTDTQDILIGNLGGQSWSTTVNDIVKCIDDETAVVISDFKTKLTDDKLRKASIVILAVNWFSQDSIFSMVVDHYLSTVWHYMAKVIFIAPGTFSYDYYAYYLQQFSKYGFLNVVIAFEDEFSFKLITLDSITGNKMLISEDTYSQFLLIDRLKDMQGFEYKIIVYEQQPRVMMSREVFTHLLYFLYILKDVQNSNIRILFIRDHSKVEHYWSNRHMHLTVNTAVTLNSTDPKLLTYEVNGYCALIPLPPKFPMFDFIFIKLFDGLTWMFLALSIVSCVVVFSMFRGRGAVGSPWLLGYGMFVYFIGQGVDFSRRNRPVLTILIQLIILMIFVLSNAYEGVITSFMIQPIQENRLKTVEDLLASDFEILTDEAFDYMVRDSTEFQAIRSRIRIAGQEVKNQFDTFIMQQAIVFIRPCDIAEYELSMKLKNGKLKSEYYYKLPEVLSPRYVQLEAGPLNPFIERFQYYMNLCFEAGLPHLWKIMTEQDYFKKIMTAKSDTVEYLKIQDLYQVFSILIIGYILSALVLLVELFTHDCFKNLKLRYIAIKLKNRVNQIAYKKKPNDLNYKRGAFYYIIHRHQKVKRLKPKKLKVRKIFIKSRSCDQ